MTKEQLLEIGSFTIGAGTDVYHISGAHIVDSFRDIHADEYMIYRDNLRCIKYLFDRDVVVEIPLNKIIKCQEQ